MRTRRTSIFVTIVTATSYLRREDDGNRRPTERRLILGGSHVARDVRSAQPLSRAKAKDARGTWSGLIIATELSVRWRYAAKPVECGAEPVAAG
jgi:hypothetical protein